MPTHQFKDPSKWDGCSSCTYHICKILRPTAYWDVYLKLMINWVIYRCVKLMQLTFKPVAKIIKYLDTYIRSEAKLCFQHY